MTTTPAVERFTLDGVPPRERGHRWEEILSATHFDTAVRVSPSRPGRPYRASVRRVLIDDLTLVDTRCGPCTGARGRSRIKGADDDHVVVQFTRAGRELVAQDGDSRELRGGDSIVWDTARPTRFEVLEPLVKRSLLIPRTALREVGEPPAPLPGVLAAAAPATRLLARHLDALARSMEGMSPTAAASARNATLHLVAAALHAAPPPSGPAAEGPVSLRRMAVERWIERNLTRWDLTPSVVASEHLMSVRTLHRLFEETGETVAGFVRTRRLARARGELITGAEPVSAIAARWGFSDPSHFARAFSAVYGTAPTNYRARRLLTSRTDASGPGH
ncbi:helix-turn-helix domain-containing protein [Streptomyces sp. NPDC048636]|uniref:helix-turn-helix domain-containing protein n=1 Tax=Streptomyces sp. NPDC048636 TaxID=3155762 RepID=UPI00344000CF